MTKELKIPLEIFKERLLEEKKINKIRNKEIKERDAEISRLRALVTKDELTGAMNRRGFLEELERIYSDVNYAKKDKDIKRRFYIDTVALLYIDIDNFKKANDIYGHNMGDKILKQVVIILENSVRKIDFVGRLGGDEFAVALVGSSIDDAYEIADKIRGIAEKKIKLPKKEKIKKIPKITLSIGVSSSEDSKDSKLLIKKGDSAMYEAKHKYGGNKVTKYLS